VTAAVPSARCIRRGGRRARAALFLVAGAIVMAAVVKAGANPVVTVRGAGDPLVVTGTVAFMVVEPAQGSLRLSVIQRLTTAPGHVVLRTERDRLVFPLPEVAPPPRHSEPVDFVSGWRRPRVVNGVITDAAPPLSGAEVAYALVFQLRGTTATLRWILPYGATDVELLVPERGVRASGIGLRDRGVVIERGRRYVRWSGGPVAPGEAVSVRLNGLPVPDGRWPEIAAGVLAVALAGGLVAALRHRPPPVPSGKEWAA
jgi:hypothetical protein